VRGRCFRSLRCFYITYLANCLIPHHVRSGSDSILFQVLGGALPIPSSQIWLSSVCSQVAFANSRTHVCYHLSTDHDFCPNHFFSFLLHLSLQLLVRQRIHDRYGWSCISQSNLPNDDWNLFCRNLLDRPLFHYAWSTCTGGRNGRCPRHHRSIPNETCK
jgi:hypothetical protein